jgi:Domain of unknown function (DUF4386)
LGARQELEGSVRPARSGEKAAWLRESAARVNAPDSYRQRKIALALNCLYSQGSFCSADNPSLIAREATWRAPQMMNRNEEASPRFMARMTGVFYLLTMLAGIFSQFFVSGRLIDFSDAAATANNILTHKSLFEWSFTVYMIEMACQVAVTALFYELLKPVSGSVSLLAAFLGLVGCVIKTMSRLFYLAPLFVLGSAHYLSVFSLQQRQALALLFLTVNDHGAAIALAFFGFYELLTGYLIFKSTFLPRILGVLSECAGLGWLTFLSPTLGYRLFPYLAAFAFLGVVALVLWLLVFGVNEERWKERARVAAAFVLT